MNYEPFISSANPQPEWPADRLPGCLPRRSRYGEWFPKLEDHITVVPRNQWAQIAAAQTPKRKYVQSVLDQDGVGSCATESTTGAVMLTRAIAGMNHVLLNPWFIYHHTSGGRDGGSSIDDNLRFIQEYGIAPEAVWPRSKGWREKPSQEAYDAAKQFCGIEVFDIGSVDEMVSALLLGYVVVWGANGHSVLKIDYIDETKGLDLNSWGTGWGDGGFGVWTNYKGVQWGYGAWALRTVTEANAKIAVPHLSLAM